MSKSSTTRQPIAYSYLRFSSMAQEEGDSIRRQTELAEAWSARTGIPLDRSLKIDRGLSGFTGENLDLGALGEFLAAIRSKKVRPGDYLVVEALDRITREEEDTALFLILSMTQAGVKIVQLQPREEIYEKGCGLSKLVTLVVELSRGHGESKLKSTRVGGARRAGRKAARETGAAIKQRHPAWLSLPGCRCRVCQEHPPVGPGWQVIEARAAVLRRIYTLASEGWGSPRIADLFNYEKVPTLGPSGAWNRTFICALLRDGRALGQFQPCGPDGKPEGQTVAGYYPAIVSTELAQRARAAVVQRKWNPGRTGEHVNLFAGLVIEADTGARLHRCVASKGYGDRVVLMRDQYPGFGVPRWAVSYRAFERAILSRLDELPVDSLDDQAPAAEVEALTTQLDDARKRQARLAVLLARDPSETIETAARAVDDEVLNLTERWEEAQRQLATPAGECLDQAKQIIARLDDAEDVTAERLHLRQLIRSVVEGIWVIVVPKLARRVVACQVRLAGGRLREYLIVIRKGRSRAGYLPSDPPRMGVFSLPREMGKDSLDFRETEHVQRLRSELEELDVESIELPDVLS